MGECPTTSKVPTFDPLSDPCLSCGLYKGKQHPCIQPKEIYHENAATVAPVVFLAEAPGPDEDKVGSNFVGRSGRIVRGILDRLSLRDPIFLNAVACWPAKVDRTTRAPSMREVGYCSTFLQESLRRLRPGVVVCLGKTAAKALGLPDMRLQDLRRRVWRPQEGPLAAAGLSDVLVHVTWHPAASLRPGKIHLQKELEDDLTRILSGNRTLTSVENHGILSIEGGDKRLVIDIETDGFLKDIGPHRFGRKGEIILLGTDKGEVK